MNTGHVQGVMGPRGGTVGNPQNQNGLQRTPHPGMQQYQRDIIASLHRDPVPLGWQKGVPLPPRASFINQLVTALRLLPNPLELNEAVNVACAFERSTIIESQDKAAYDNACLDKLRLIQIAREKQAQNLESLHRDPSSVQMNMAIPQNQMQLQARSGMQNNTNLQLQHAFPHPQFHGSMQASPLPMQQHPSQQLQQKQFHSNGGSTNSQIPTQHMQQLQNVPQNLTRPMPQNPGQVNLTPQENHQINSMAQQMRNKASPQDLEIVEEKIRHMPPNQRMVLDQQNIEPVFLYYRRQAANMFMAQRSRAMASQHQIQSNMPNVSAATPQQHPAMNPNTSNMTPQQFGSAPGNQVYDPAFGNMQQFGSQILGLQQQGLRSQEEGQVVVPASGAAKPPQPHQQQGVMQAMPQHPLINQPNPSRSNANHPQFLLQQEKMQQVARMQAQAQIQNAGGIQVQPSQQNVLQGQAGGLNMNQMIPQQSPAMPNLNRPIGPPMQQQQNYGTPQQRQQSTLPQNQMSDGVPQNQRMQQRGPNTSLGTAQAGNGQQGNQQLPDFRQLPLQMQQKLASLPPDQQRLFVANLQQKARMASIARTKASNGIPSAQDTSGDQHSASNGQRTLQRNQGQRSGLQNTGAFMSTATRPQDTSLMTTSVQQSTPAHGSEQRNQQQQQQQQQQNDQPRMSQAAANMLDELQVQRMDTQPYPRNILAYQVEDTLPPQGVKLWGELKAWVAQNINSMPPGILEKLKGLQALHYQNLVARQLNPPLPNKARQPAQNQAPQTSTPFPQPGPAPPAQMVPSRSSQLPPQTMTLPRTVTPNLTVSSDDLLNVRNRYPKMKELTDDRLREILVQKKRAFLEQQMAQRQITNPSQTQYENLQRAQNQQLQRQAFTQSIQGGQGRSQQVTIQGQQAISTNNQGSTPLGGQSALQSDSQIQHVRGAARAVNPPQPLSNQKGTKRSNEDDVVEVPNPNIALQQQRRLQQPGKQGPITQNTNAPKPKREQPISVSQNQQQPQPSQYELELRKQAAQSTGVSQQQQSGPKSKSAPDNAPQPGDEQEKAKQNYRFKQILAEVVQSVPHRRVVPVDQQTRERMVHLLKENVDLITRISSIEQLFFGLSRNEDVTKDLIRTRIMTMNQYRDELFSPVDQFTMTHQELEVAIQKLKTTFSSIMKHHQKYSGMARQPQQIPKTFQTSATAPSATPQLQKQEPEPQSRQGARQAPMQRMHSSRENRAPAAPTSDRPPFSFSSANSPPPDGVPQAYGPTQLTQEKLTIPPAKRRKVQNQGAGSMGSVAQQNAVQTSTSPTIQKAASPRMPKATNIFNGIKCTVPFCENGEKGFQTVEDLARHTRESHQDMEPEIDNPLEWALEGIRIGLNINPDGKLNVDKQQKAHQTMPTAPTIKKSTSSQGLGAAKLDLETPMTRNPTQAGSQSNLSLPRTPQHEGGSFRTPASDTRSTLPKSTKVDPAKTASAVKEPVTPPPDDWEGIPISPSDLAAYFPRGIDLQGGVDFLALTPESTSPSDKSDATSPKKSDIDENDELQINIKADNWLPASFFHDLAVPQNDSSFVDDEILGMDWETVFGPIQVEESKGGRGKRGDQVGGPHAFDTSLFSYDP